MLTLLDIGIEKAVAFRFGGKITEAEMTSALSAVKEKIDRHGEVYLYEEIESIGGAEFDAMIEKIKFLHEYGISKITKIAVITDKKWMHKIIAIEDKVFRKIAMKCFLADDREKAIEFLRTE